MVISHTMTSSSLSRRGLLKSGAALAAALPSGPVGSHGIGLGGLDAKALLAWLAVGIPIAWGVWITLQSAVKIFQ